jgi:lycopene cyclase domain-containing protein
VSLGVFTWNLDKIYTAASFGLFALLMLFQMLFQWKYARRFYQFYSYLHSFLFVNSALTGSYSENPVVFYNDAENLGIRVGTMPLEDSFYCFSMLYGSVLFSNILEKMELFSKCLYLIKIKMKLIYQTIRNLYTYFGTNFINFFRKSLGFFYSSYQFR